MPVSRAASPRSSPKVRPQGLSDLDGWNEAGIRAYDGRSEADVLDEWRTSNAETRRGFRERDELEIDSSIGAYPARLQAFHVAQELATHADDVGVPVTEAERVSRRSWRARVSRFALSELKPELRIDVAGDFTMVRGAAASVTLDEDDLIAAVAGRLRPGGRADAAARALLSTMP